MAANELQQDKGEISDEELVGIAGGFALPDSGYPGGLGLFICD
jgi:hypothetical protein